MSRTTAYSGEVVHCRRALHLKEAQIICFGREEDEDVCRMLAEVTCTARKRVPFTNLHKVNILAIILFGGF